MSKDPAILWYWGDWYSGTVLMSRFLKGCYIDLLHAQFNNGHLSLEDIKTCLGADYGQSWPTLQKKFKQDQDGLFFNERLEREKLKRAAYSKSRAKNREGGGKKTYVDTYVKHMSLHMSPHMENENRIEKKEGVKGEKEKHTLSDTETKNTVEFCAITLQRSYTTDRIRQLWDAFLIQNGSEVYNKATDRVRHFRNWIKTQPYEPDTAKKPPPGSHTPPPAVDVLRQQEEERKRDRERILANANHSNLD